MILKAHYRDLYQIVPQTFNSNNKQNRSICVGKYLRKIHNDDVKVLTLRSYNRGKLAEVNILCTQQSRKAGTEREREKNPQKSI